MKRCLIVDDSKVIRMIARNMMQEFGFETSEAENGQEALTACEEAFPDAILLDWNMPVMNGIDFLRALRALPGGNAPKVVFCTTETDLDNIRTALEAGANEYIMKPFDNQIMQAKLAQVGLL
jgi:two-component system chemotaxis response regulator CheY